MSISFVSVNGLLLDQVSALDRGLAYGDGLFETVLVRRGERVFCSAHLQRLQTGAERLRIPFPAGLVNALDQFQSQVARQYQATDGILKLILTRGSGGRGYLPPEPAEPNLILQWHPAPTLPSASNLSGIALYQCRHRLPERIQLPGLKSLNRLDNVLARAEFSGTSYGEGLMLDFADRVIEGTMTNLFWVKKGSLFTPSLEDVGVHGIMRAQIMQRFTTVCTSATVETLLNADELFLCNSVNGIWPVVEFKQQKWQPGCFTKQIQSEFLQFF